MHTEVNGIRVNYRVEGTGERWVTFVTGIANDLSMRDPQVGALERDFRILRYDLRGHGRTAASKPPYTMELLVRDLVALLDALKIERTRLVGLGLAAPLARLRRSTIRAISRPSPRAAAFWTRCEP